MSMGNTECQPHFVVIGAVKAATTWIQKQLQRNPRIYMPDPEPHFFSSHFEQGHEFYRSFFKDAPSGAVKGEKSADYLAHPDAASRLARCLPRSRLVVQLRDPVERAYSDYKMFYRRGTVHGPPEDFLACAECPHPRFLRDGLYGLHLERWLDHFPQEQVLVYLHDDVIASPEGVVRTVSAHIGVEPHHAPASYERENDSSAKILPLGVRRALSPLKPAVRHLRGEPLFEATRALLAKEIRYPPLSPVLRAHLREFYRQDLAKLERLTKRDLSAWM